MFELLMELPLFRGATHQRISEIVGSAKFHFLKYPEEEIVVRAGDECEYLTFIIGGSVRVSVANETGRFEVSSTLNAPAVVAPDFLFGRLTHFPCTVKALTTCSVLQICKSDVMRILAADEVFMFNYLNMVSVNAQKLQKGLLTLTMGDLDCRIAYWAVALSPQGSEDVVLSCSTKDLCTLFNVSRSTFEAAVKRLKALGLIEYTNHEIRVLDRRGIAELLLHEGDNSK